jgi:hypothetical protein
MPQPCSLFDNFSGILSRNVALSVSSFFLKQKDCHDDDDPDDVTDKFAKFGEDTDGPYQSTAKVVHETFVAVGFKLPTVLQKAIVIFYSLSMKY